MRTLVIGTLFLVMATAAGTQDFSRIEFRDQELAPNVHWLQGAGGNVLACMGPEGVLLIDTDYEEMSEKLVQAVADRKVIDADVPASPTAAWPTMVITEPLVIHWGAEEIVVMPATGHTGGDLFFNCGYPYIDTAHGGSIDGFTKAGRFVLDQGDDETLIVPGHGPVVQREEARPCFAMIAEYRDLVAAERARGLHRDDLDIIAGRPQRSLGLP